MAILPVSSVSFKNNNVNFKSSNNNEETEMVSTPIISEAPKAIPVMVLMALSPSLLNAAVPKTMEESSNTPKVVMVEDAPEQEISEATYVMSPELQETQQSSAPFGWEMFNTTNIKYTAPAKCNGADYTVVYTSFKKDPASVDYIYLVKSSGNKPNRNVNANPPEIARLIYHDLGENDFLEAVVNEDVINKEGKVAAQIRRGVRLDDKTAQDLIYLIENKSKWKNETNIKIASTQSTELRPYTDR